MPRCCARAGVCVAIQARRRPARRQRHHCRCKLSTKSVGGMRAAARQASPGSTAGGDAATRLHTRERRQLFLVDERESVREVHEVLEARVQVRLRAERHHHVPVRVVDVGVHAEEALEDGAHRLHERARKRLVGALREYLGWRVEGDRKSAAVSRQRDMTQWAQSRTMLAAHRLVVQLALYPLHQVQHVRRRAALDRLLHLQDRCGAHTPSAGNVRVCVHACVRVEAA
jgi:hypothetical protein